jgi:hypothetical protein
MPLISRLFMPARGANPGQNLAALLAHSFDTQTIGYSNQFREATDSHLALLPGAINVDVPRIPDIKANIKANLLVVEACCNKRERASSMVSQSGDGSRLAASAAVLHVVPAVRGLPVGFADNQISVTLVPLLSSLKINVGRVGHDDSEDGRRARTHEARFLGASGLCLVVILVAFSVLLFQVQGLPNDVFVVFEINNALKCDLLGHGWPCAMPSGYPVLSGGPVL